MTIFFPDVSYYQAGLVIQPGTTFLWARATMGLAQDTSYKDFQSQAEALGVPFGAYHFLHAGNGPAQADNAFAVVGAGVPLFVDVEPIIGSSYPTTADVNAFVGRYRALGGTCLVQYYPEWYAASQGANLALTGLLTIASGYPGSYSDTASEWDSYNGITPFEWQYTSSQSYGGKSVDFNAYKGTIAEYLTAIGYLESTPSSPPLASEENDMFCPSDANGRAGLSFQVGGIEVVQAVYDGAVGASPDVRIVVLYTTGPVVLTAQMANGQYVYTIPNYETAYGILFEAQNTSAPYYLVGIPA